MFDSLEMNELHRKINNDSNLQGSINDSTIFKRAASKRQEA